MLKKAKKWGVVLGQLTHKSNWLPILAQVMIPGLWDRALNSALHWVWSLLEILSLSPLPLSPTHPFSLSLPKIKIAIRKRRNKIGKRNEVLIHVRAWKYLENILRIGRSQLQMSHMVLFIWYVWNWQIHRESRPWLAGPGGGRKQRLTLTGTGFLGGVV